MKTNLNLKIKQQKQRGFTLIELLTVLGIVAAIAVLAVPAFSSVQRSTALTRAEDELLGELSLARQHAISMNRDVEVRIIRHKDTSLPGSQLQFRSVQSYTYSSTGEATPLRIMRSIPPQAIMDAGSGLSSLLVPARKKSWQGGDAQPVLPGLGTDYEAYAFRFRPDGGTDLAAFPATPWFITIHDRAAGDNLAAPPVNYATVVLDPISGQASSYRP